MCERIAVLFEKNITSRTLPTIANIAKIKVEDSQVSDLDDHIIFQYLKNVIGPVSR